MLSFLTEGGVTSSHQLTSDFVVKSASLFEAVDEPRSVDRGGLTLPSVIGGMIVLVGTVSFCLKECESLNFDQSLFYLCTVVPVDYTKNV
jgi:hypothetical protein